MPWVFPQRIFSLWSTFLQAPTLKGTISTTLERHKPSIQESIGNGQTIPKLYHSSIFTHCQAPGSAESQSFPFSSLLISFLVPSSKRETNPNSFFLSLPFKYAVLLPRWTRLQPFHTWKNFKSLNVFAHHCILWAGTHSTLQFGLDKCQLEG